MKLKLTRLQIGFCVLTWVIVAVTLLLTALSWNHLPEQVPTHYNFAGQADAWGGKGTVWFVPVVMVIACGVVEVCARLRPDHINIPVKVRPGHVVESYRMMRTMCFVLNAQMALTFFLIQLATLLGVPKLTQASFVVLFLMAVTVAGFCVRLRQINRP